MIHNHFQIYWAWSAWVVIRELSDFHDKFDWDRNNKFDLDRNDKFDLDRNDKFDLSQDLNFPDFLPLLPITRRNIY